MKCYEITPDRGCGAHTEKDLYSAITAINEWLKDSEKGTELIVKVIEMSESEYDSLPEYDGP